MPIHFYRRVCFILLKSFIFCLVATRKDFEICHLLGRIEDEQALGAQGQKKLKEYQVRSMMLQCQILYLFNKTEGQCLLLICLVFLTDRKSVV